MSWMSDTLEKSLGTSIKGGAEQFVMGGGWTKVMEMLMKMKKKKKIRSLKIMSLEFDVIDKIFTEVMLVIVQLINLLMN